MARTPSSSAVWRSWASATSAKSPRRAAAGCAAPRCRSREPGTRPTQRKPRVAPGQPEPQTVEEIAAALPAGAWKRLQFREGTKGTQVAHFAAIRLVVERDDLPGPELWLVIERSCDQAPYIKYYTNWPDGGPKNENKMLANFV